MKRESGEWLACMLVASVGLVYSLWVVAYFPTVDGPQHILSAHIENHYSDAGSSYPEFYRTLPQFAAKGFSLIYAPLEALLPWRVALRVALSLIGLAFAWGFALVVLAIDRERREVAMLGFAIALPWSLYMGFFPFVVGTTFGLYTLLFFLRRPPTTLARGLLLALLLTVQAVCHVFTAVLTAVVLVVLAATDAPKGQRLRALATMTGIVMPTAAILGLAYSERGVQNRAQEGIEWSLGERVGELSRWFVPGPGARGWLLIVLVVGATVATLARTRSGKVTAREQALAWLALAFLALTLFTPLHMPGWSFFAPRFAILTMVLGLALLRMPQALASPRARRALVPLFTAGCLGSSLLSASLHRELATGCADSLSGLDAPLHFSGPRLPIILDSFCGTPRHAANGPVPRASMAHNSPLLYLLDHGGIATKVFNGVPSVHAIGVIRGRMPPLPDPRAETIAQSQWLGVDPKLRAAVLTDLAAGGMPFEGIHVVGGRAADFAVFNERGYVTELQGDALFIGRFEGCKAELVLPAGVLDREPVTYEYGLFSPVSLTPEPRALAAGTIKRDAPVTGTSIRVPLTGRPCGEIWVRVVWDVDGSSSLTPGDRTCENADAQGRLRATVARTGTAVPCAPHAFGAPTGGR